MLTEILCECSLSAVCSRGWGVNLNRRHEDNWLRIPHRDGIQLELLPWQRLTKNLVNISLEVNVKYKVFPVHAMKAHWGVELQFLSFLILARDGGVVR
jgi:hypothetical protein